MSIFDILDFGLWRYKCFQFTGYMTTLENLGFKGMFGKMKREYKHNVNLKTLKLICAIKLN